MKSDTDAVFDSANELRVCRGRGRGEMAGPYFAVDRQESAEGQLKSTSVAPGADGVGERRGLRAALQPKAGKAVGHEAFPKSGIDGPEEQVSVGRPDKVGGAWGGPERASGKGGNPQSTAAPDSHIRGSHAERESPEGSGYGGGVIEGSVKLDSACHLGNDTDR